MTTATLNVSQIRSHFPALDSGYIFADNAGGSQIPREVVDRISDYLLNTNVQINVDYSVSKKSTARVAEGLKSAVELLNAESTQNVILGGSSTANMDNLVRHFDGEISEGDEFILMDGEHEANNGTWKKLAERTGAVLKYWYPTQVSPSVNPCAIFHQVEELLPLITSRTRIVAFSGCSNILGSAVPIKEISRSVRDRAKAQGANKLQISVDCVAYAPHRRIDVQDWDIDFCMLSFYKVYGPHAAALYARPVKNYPRSSVAHELVYGTTGILPYLLSLTPYNDLKSSFDAIARHEHSLLEPLLAFLTHPDQRKKGLMIVGEETASTSRVPTVSFVVQGVESKEIVKMVNRRGGVGIRWYNYSCTSASGHPLPVQSGVARISLVHYNTVEEVYKIIEILRETLSPSTAASPDTELDSDDSSS
jgi:selenocysteine lyase/cysteine desulfurase